MIQTVLGKLQFNTGWKTNGEVTVFGQTYRITIKAGAYAEKDGVTDAQVRAFSDYKDHMTMRMAEIEELLGSYAKEGCDRRFTPRTLLFERDGEYAMLCDDADEPDDGIAIVLSPQQKIVSQDDYL